MILLVANKSRFDKECDGDGQISSFSDDVYAEGDQLFEDSPLIPPPPTNKSSATYKLGAKGDIDNSIATDPTAAPEGLKEEKNN